MTSWEYVKLDGKGLNKQFANRRNRADLRVQGRRSLPSKRVALTLSKEVQKAPKD
uniref:Uncharacterized protein n=1 Tax=Arion vulgaris TaxID=1028688 RepID=A0A0B6YIP7_9EUPU